jgi:hypothetical protein
MNLPTTARRVLSLKDANLVKRLFLSERIDGYGTAGPKPDYCNAFDSHLF